MAFGSAGPSTIFTSMCFHWAPNAAMPSAVNRSTTYAGGRTGASCGGDVGGSGWADAASIDRAMASIVPATSLARSRVLMVVLPFLMTARASAAAATRPPSPSGCCRSRARTRSPSTASTSWPGPAACRHDTDTSGALVGRLIVLVLVQSFFGREDPVLTTRLLTELPGILNWALVGYLRLRERGYFIQPASAREAVED